MKTTDERPPKWIGPLVIVLALPVYFATPSEGVPRWIVLAAASAFLFAGLGVANMSVGNSKVAKSFGRATGVMLMSIMNGIAFFARDPLEARTGFSMGGLSFTRHGTQGRIFFQVLTLACDVVIVIAIGQRIRRSANRYQASRRQGQR